MSSPFPLFLSLFCGHPLERWTRASQYSDDGKTSNAVREWRESRTERGKKRKRRGGDACSYGSEFKPIDDVLYWCP